MDDEIKKWKKIHKIIEIHKSSHKSQLNFKFASQLHYGHSGHNDYNETLKKNEIFRKQSFRWSKDNMDKNEEDQESDSLGSGSEDEREFDNALFKNDIGSIIGEHNKMQKSKSSHDQSPRIGTDPQVEKVPEELKKKSLATNTTFDTSYRETQARGPKEVGSSKPDGNIEESKDSLGISPKDDYFELIQQQFLSSQPASRNCVFRKRKDNAAKSNAN